LSTLLFVLEFVSWGRRFDKASRWFRNNICFNLDIFLTIEVNGFQGDVYKTRVEHLQGFNHIFHYGIARAIE
jgi:hypothetical protein